MRLLAFAPSTATFLAVLSVSIAGDTPGRQLLHGEKRELGKRSYFDSLGSLFGKRDDCTTQFGETYVDCGPTGCFQPSLGETCCGANSLSCPKGQFCGGNYCCPDGLTADCCFHGNGCPANVSSYYTSSPVTSSTSRTAPMTIPASASVEASITSAEISTSTLAVVTTPLTTTTAVPLTVQSTSSVTTVGGTTKGAGVVTTGISSPTISAHSGGGASTIVAGSGAQNVRIRVDVEGAAIGALGVLGLLAGLF